MMMNQIFMLILLMTCDKIYCPNDDTKAVYNNIPANLETQQKEQIGVKFSKKGTFMYFICFTVNR